MGDQPTNHPAIGRAPRVRTWIWLAAALIFLLLAAIAYVAGRHHRTFCLTAIFLCSAAATTLFTLAFYEVERSLQRSADRRWLCALLETFKRILVLFQLLTTALALGALGLWWFAARIPGS